MHLFDDYLKTKRKVFFIPFSQQIWSHRAIGAISWDKEFIKVSCKESLKTELTSSISSAETHTPDELRAISLIRTPEYSPAPPNFTLNTRAFRLPVLMTKPTDKGETMVPAPPNVPQTKMIKAIPKLFKHTARAVSKPRKKPVTGSVYKPRTSTVRKELQPLLNPVESLSHCLQQMSSDDWRKKIIGMKIIQALTLHHPQTLKTKLHQVCSVLIQEVKNLRSAVACEAISTVGGLYVNLQTAMDQEVERTGKALLLSMAQNRAAFCKKQTSLALDAMVKNCSLTQIVNVLLNTGLMHPHAVVRASMAQHLHQVVERVGAARILTTERSFTDPFLRAVAKMSMDAAPDVRHHGQLMFQEMARQRDFMRQWEKIRPEDESSAKPDYCSSPPARDPRL
ncbi:TOG array regulator of axonemal microtubules 1-like [Solea senegalensis]|uniref:TOG array regulator of axonemal microtubules 1-like n=1 Tax=Solea senegalensis TaxID=28829 RepID=A0AAV6SCB6_SOLSE|nr:TOG array regulator of axonemal microtubules 1-like [Solea senegalensis]